jgi:transcription elongation factor Elf1
MIPNKWFNLKFKKNNKMSKDKVKKYLLSIKKECGLSCPECESDNFWNIESRNILHCKNCDHQISATTGTLFHNIQDIEKWIQAFWLMCDNKEISKNQLKKLVGFGSPNTVDKCVKIIQLLMGEHNSKLFTSHIYLDTFKLTINYKSQYFFLASTKLEKNDLPKKIMIKKIDHYETNYNNFIKTNIRDKKFICFGDFIDLSKNQNMPNKYKFSSPITTLNKIYDLFKEWYNNNYRFRSFPDNFDYLMPEFVWRYNNYKLDQKNNDFKVRNKQKRLFEELIRLSFDYELKYENKS